VGHGPVVVLLEEDGADESDASTSSSISALICDTVVCDTPDSQPNARTRSST